LCRLSESVLVLHRRDHPEGGMASAPVVDPFDPVADGEFSRRLGEPQVTIIELDFHCRPKGFDLRIVPTHTGAAN
jgi:hypothetical protein